MSGPSTIEWTERTLNPTTGCDRVSPGCDNCYAATLAKRLKAMGQPRYQADGDPRTSGPGFALTLHPEVIDEARGWRKPAVVFVNSMSDLFHAKVPYEFVERVWGTMAETPQHTYQILTKRPDRMARFAGRLAQSFGVLPNVWLGTSIESQEYIGRAEWLTLASAAVRFLSCEPLLGPLDLESALEPDSGIQWVIIGGESGPGARPMELRWARDLVDQCRAAGVAPFVKQLGSVWAGRGKGGDMEAWPADLRVRELPAGWRGVA